MVNCNHKMDNKQRLLLYLAKNFDREYSILDLSKTLDIPYTTALRSIKRLKKELVMRSIGASTVVSLNVTYELNKASLALASHEEKEEYLQKSSIMSLIVKELRTDDVVLLFGSYAKRTQTEKSDIDLIIINATGKKTLSFRNQELLLNKEINPMFFTEEEFREMIIDKEENVGKQALRTHVVLNNSLKFWELVIHAIQ